MNQGLRSVVVVTCCATVATIVAVMYQIAIYQRAFEVSFSGEEIALVKSRFGEPSVREVEQQPYLRYATSSCKPPCAQRLWWEHPVFRGVEAWSVEFDGTGHLINKAHWVSP